MPGRAKACNKQQRGTEPIALRNQMLFFTSVDKQKRLYKCLKFLFATLIKIRRERTTESKNQVESRT